MRDTRHIDDYLIVPWMGFPFEESALTKGIWLFGFLIILWAFILHVLESLIHSFAESNLFKSAVPSLIDAYTYTFQWGWLLVIALSFWGWEQWRYRNFRKLMK